MSKALYDFKLACFGNCGAAIQITMPQQGFYGHGPDPTYKIAYALGWLLVLGPDRGGVDGTHEFYCPSCQESAHRVVKRREMLHGSSAG